MVKDVLTLKQMKAIELLAAGRISKDQVCVECKMNRSTLTRWQRKPFFMHAVVARSRALLKQSLPAVYDKLADKSKDGSHHHIKILLDHMEKLEDAKAGQTSITFTWKNSHGE